MKKRVAKGSYGISFEGYVINRFGLVEEKDPTHKWDAYTKDGVPVSIKLAGIDNEIIFSDIFTQYFNKEDFFLVLGVWNEERSVADSLSIMRVRKEDWRRLFSSRDAMEIFYYMVKKYEGKIGDRDRERWARLREHAYKMFAEDTLDIIKPRARFVSPSKSERERMKAEHPGVCLNDIEYDRKKYGKHRIQCASQTRSFIKNFILERKSDVTFFERNVRFTN